MSISLPVLWCRASRCLQFCTLFRVEILGGFKCTRVITKTWSSVFATYSANKLPGHQCFHIIKRIRVQETFSKCYKRGHRLQETFSKCYKTQTYPQSKIILRRDHRIIIANGDNIQCLTIIQTPNSICIAHNHYTLAPSSAVDSLLSIHSSVLFAIIFTTVFSRLSTNFLVIFLQSSQILTGF